MQCSSQRRVVVGSSPGILKFRAEDMAAPWMYYTRLPAEGYPDMPPEKTGGFYRGFSCSTGILVNSSSIGPWTLIRRREAL